MPSDRVLIFDTTLRDGEQSPGASLNTGEKVEIARQLELLGVDAIEAGFPVTSRGDFEAVDAVARAVKKPIVCGLARCTQKDIEAARDALERAKRPRIHVFLATSAIHRKYKLKKAREEIVRMAVEGVRLARRYCDDVEFSPEDASRTEPDFLAQVVREVIEAGASTVNIPDTVGYAVPGQFGPLIGSLVEQVDNIDRAVISVHCHNDLGLAVANSLAAVDAGARQVECTINGLGERAGNCALEEVVMALSVRGDAYGPRTGIESKYLYPTSHMVSTFTGMQVQRNKAIVGDNAFAHESGIHQDGVLKKASTYEIMDPRDVGRPTSDLVLGKHSGRHALREHARKLGYVLTPEQVDELYAKFKELADRKKEVFDGDIVAIVEDELSEAPEKFVLVDFHVTSGKGTAPTATVCLETPEGERLRDAACGSGPIEAIFSTIDRITGIEGSLEDYRIRAVTRGRDALGEVSLTLVVGKERFPGHGASTDVLESSTAAYLKAMNKAAIHLEGEAKRKTRKKTSKTKSAGRSKKSAK